MSGSPELNALAAALPRTEHQTSTTTTCTPATVLRKGYDAYYFYGGNSYFDNMETFFGGNGYRIIDQKATNPKRSPSPTSGGVCDEDAYDKGSDPLARRAGRYDRSALLRPRHDGQQPPALHLPAGRIRLNDAKSAFGRRRVHRLRIARTLLRRGQPPTLVR